MNKLQKVPIFFMGINAFVKKYINNENIDLNCLGIEIETRVILSQVLYGKHNITYKPHIIKVDISTFKPERKQVLIYIIEEIIVKQKQLGNRNLTISTNLSKIINFINWVNKNNFCFLNNIDKARNVFLQYTYYLKDRIRLGTYSTKEAHTNHKAAHKMLYSIYNDKENKILSNNRIITCASPTKKREKSTKSDQKYHFQFCNNLFHQLSDFLLEEKEYPLKLDMPSGNIWCLPSKRNFINNIKDCPLALKYDTGGIRSAEEIMEQDITKTLNIRNARAQRKSFIDNLNIHNLNKRSHKRIALGYTALMAYFLSFLSATGMNDSVAATLLWSDDYKIEKNKQKFKNIKYRAGNKPVEFQLGSKLVKDFHKYLKLREFLLDGKDFEYLFFMKDGDSQKLSQRQKGGSFSTYINRIFIKTIDSQLPSLKSQQLRVNKTHKVIEKNGIIAASQLAQSSIVTIIDSYLGESQESTDEQLGEYFNLLNQNIFKEKNNEKDTAIGQCDQPYQADSDIELNGINIDCSASEGCLFCIHYSSHADEKDINKLYSLEYIINESRYVAKNEAHFLSVYGIILDRIENIVIQIIKEKRQTKHSVEQFRKDVFENENLHPYWEHKLKTLIKMGVLT